MELGADQSNAAWGFGGVVITAILTQIRIAISAKREREKRQALESSTSHSAFESFMDSRDARVFKILVDRLEATEKAHKACEEKVGEMLREVSLISRKFDWSIYGMDIMRRAMESNGITMPALPVMPTMG